MPHRAPPPGEQRAPAGGRLDLRLNAVDAERPGAAERPAGGAARVAQDAVRGARAHVAEQHGDGPAAQRGCLLAFALELTPTLDSVRAPEKPMPFAATA